MSLERGAGRRRRSSACPRVRHGAEPTASADLVRILLRHGARMGLSTEDLLRAADLDPAALDAPGARVPLPRFSALWNAVALRAGDPDFGLRFGAAMVGSASGHLLLAILRNCPTVAEAVDRLFRYHSLMADIERPSLIRAGSTACLVWAPPAGAPSHRHEIEAVLASFAGALRQVTEDRFVPREVRLRRPSQNASSEPARIFGAPVIFGSPADEIAFDADLLQLPIPVASRELLRELEGIGRRLLSKEERPAIWAERCASVIRELLMAGGRTGVHEVASRLSMGGRTLQTKLRGEGTTLRAVLDEVRRDLAAALLGRPDLALFDVAFALGFSEQSGFNHAFKRWTGLTPSEFRRQPPAPR